MFDAISTLEEPCVPGWVTRTGLTSLALTVVLHVPTRETRRPESVYEIVIVHDWHLVDEVCDWGISDLAFDPPLPFDLLKQAGAFQEPGAGCTGLPQVFAWREILADPDADATFKRLLVEGSLAGQLYALAGLYYTDPEYFRTVVGPFLFTDAVVPAQVGCRFGGVFASSLASNIERGGLAAALRGVRPLAPPAGGRPVP